MGVRVATVRATITRVGLLAVGVAALAVLAVRFPLHAIPATVREFGAVGPVAGVLLFTALLMALFPRTPISIGCGLLFGPLLGPILAIVVMVLACAATFALGRRLGRTVRTGPLIPSLQRAWVRIEGWITREGVLAVAAVRSWPLGPYGLVGYVYGASTVRVRDYALGSLIAGTPSGIAYALVGAVAGGNGTQPVLLVLLPFSLVLTAVVAWRTRARALRSSQDPTDR